MIFAQNKCFVWHECSRSRRDHVRWELCRWNRRTSPGVHLILNLKTSRLSGTHGEIMILAQNKCFVWHECSRSRRVHMRWGLCRWNRRTSPGVHLMLNLKSCMFNRNNQGEIMMFAQNKCFIWHECSRSRRVDMRWGLCRWNRRTSPGVHLILNLKKLHVYPVYMGISCFLANISASSGMSVLEAGESTCGEGCVIGIAEHPRGPFNI